MKFVLPLVMFALAGCHSGWDRDPFVNESENVKAGIPPGVQEKPIPPLKDVAFIDSSNFYDFVEGKEGAIQFGYTIAHPELQFVDFQIYDLQGILPGAEFNKKKKILTWTPPHFFVSEDSQIESIIIDVVLFVSHNGVVQELRKQVALNVLRVMEAPEIVEVTGLPDQYQEDDKGTFHAVVRSNEIDPARPVAPRVDVVRTGLFPTTNLAPYLRVTGDFQDIDDPALWHFDFRLELRDIEFTHKYSRGEFGLIAFDQYGNRSPSMRLFTRVITKLVRPEISINDRIKFYKGENNTLFFNILDPKAEGDVSGTFGDQCETIDKSMVCKCRGAKGIAKCQIAWRPEKTGTHIVKVNMENAISGGYAKQKETDRAGIQIKVIERNE